MKSETIRLTHKAKRFSLRTVAMILSIVMLVSAIFTGSMLNTFAAYVSEHADDGVVSEAATEGSDIAEGAIPAEGEAPADTAEEPDADSAVDEAQAPDLSGFEENKIVRSMKDDLTGTGANIQLSGTGYSYGHIHANFTSSGDWSSDWSDYNMTYNSSGDSNRGQLEFSIILKAGYGFQMTLFADTDEYAGSGYSHGISGASSNCDLTTSNRQNIELSTIASDTGYVKVDFYATINNSSSKKLYVEQAAAPFYLHYAENDSGMSSATIVAMTSNGDGTFSTTVSGWDKSKINMLVNNSSTNVTGTGASTSLTAVSDTGVTVDQSTPSEHSSYYRMQASLESTPQNLTFTFNKTTGVLSIAGSVQKFDVGPSASAVTNNSQYHLRATDGSNSITNNAAGTVKIKEGKTVTVQVTPADSTKKVSAITVTGTGNTISGITDMGDGSYKATFTIAADATIEATLADKQNVTVTYSSNNAEYGTVTAKKADGTTLASGGTVLEGSKITFTATPASGYGFAGWTGGFTGDDTPVTKIISSNTNVVGNFAEEGYQVYYKDETTPVTMKELSDGRYISTSTLTTDKLFTIKRTANNKYLYAANGSNAYEFKSDWKGPDNVAAKTWSTTASTSNGDYYKETASGYYVIYDPVKKTVSTTTESDGMFEKYYVYVKDGTIRKNGASYYATSADYGESSATVTVENGDTVTPASIHSDRGYEIELTAAQVRSGVSIAITTTVTDDYKTKYYVKGFDINGGITKAIVSQEFDPDTGAKLTTEAAYTDKNSYAKILGVTNPTNSYTYTLPEMPDQMIEITPIYFPLCSNSNEFVRFYAYDFTETVKDTWGGSLACYPYIENEYDPYGYYPGQLMVNEGGSYYADIPAYKPGDSTKKIQGLTMNNYIWDDVHHDLFFNGKSQTDYNYQTYDYNEFKEINELFNTTIPGIPKIDEEDIAFSFKYKENKTQAASNLGQSTYYVDSSDTSKINGPLDYRTNYNEIQMNDSQWQWEDLTDFYGKRVDLFNDRIDETSEKSNYHPILIVSNGYDYNMAGDYATAWALYVPKDASGNDAFSPSSVVDHYELFEVCGGQGRNDFESESYLIDPDYYYRIRNKYGVEQHETGTNPDGTTISRWIRDCTGIPIKITYEYEITDTKPNDSSLGSKSDKAHRSDGRWFYTSSDQEIKSNIIIEYANSKTSPYVRDYFQENNYDYTSGENYVPSANTGLVTNTKAYFTNDDLVVKKNGETVHQNVAGHTEAYAISDGYHSYSLTAEEDADGEYTFVGWYRLTESGTGYDVTPAADPGELSFSTEAKTNDVFIARYIKTPAGTLTIRHTLTSNSTGDADCEAKVEIYDDNGEKIATQPYATFSTKAIHVSSRYIKDGSTNTLKITLQTTPKDNSAFDNFYSNEAGTSVLTDASSTFFKSGGVTIDTSNCTATVLTMPIDNLFDGEGIQQISKIDFFSKLDAQLAITHHLLPADDDTLATCKVKYEIVNSGGTSTIYPSSSNEMLNGPLVVPSEYFVQTTDYRLKVTLTTDIVQNKFNDFKQFSMTKFDGTTYVFSDAAGPYSAQVHVDDTLDNYSQAQMTFTIPITNFFDAETGKPLTDTLEFFSELKTPNFKYTIEYRYDAYVKSYGTQSYTLSGYFDDFDEALDNGYTYKDYSSYYNHLLTFTGDAASTAYLKSIISANAPYEDNFRKVFDYSQAEIIYQNYNHGRESYDMIVKVNASSQEFIATFKFPYYVGDNGIPQKVVEDERVNATSSDKIYAADNSDLNKTDITNKEKQVFSGDWAVASGSRNSSDSPYVEPTFIKPALIYYTVDPETSEETAHYFQYWIVETVGSYGASSEEYTRCYDTSFDLSIFQECVITPYYTTTPWSMPNPPSTWDAYGRFDPEVNRTADSANGITIRFMENSRNQYNHNGYGKFYEADGLTVDESKTSDVLDRRKGAADRIYTDFLLSFNNVEPNVVLSEKYKDGGKKVGIIIQPVGNVSLTGGSTKTEAQYMSDYGAVVTDDMKTDVTSWLTDSSTYEGSQRYVKAEFDAKELDNKNRIRYYFGIDNRASSAYNAANPPELSDVYSNSHDLIFRAYAYIVDYNETTGKYDWTTVKFNDKPTYYTIYDMGSITNGQYPGSGS